MIINVGTLTASRSSSATTSSEAPASALSTADAVGTFTLSDSNRTAARSGSAAWKSIRGTQSRSSGKYYLEWKAKTGAGNANQMFGFANAGFAISSHIGSGSGGGGYGAGADRVGTGFTGGGASLTALNSLPINTVVQLAVDFGNQKFWFGKNGTWLASADPAGNTAGHTTFNAGTVGALFPVMSMFDVAGENGTWTIATVASQFTHSPPSGFSAWG